MADKILRMKKHKLGKVFVKYSDPINLDKYVEEFNARLPKANPEAQPNLHPVRSIKELNGNNKDIAMQLTKHLYNIQ